MNNTSNGFVHYPLINLGVMIMSFDPERDDETREASLEMAEFEELSAMYGQSNEPWSEDDED